VYGDGVALLRAFRHLQRGEGEVVDREAPFAGEPSERCEEKEQGGEPWRA